MTHVAFSKENRKKPRENPTIVIYIIIRIIVIIIIISLINKMPDWESSHLTPFSHEYQIVG
jgi:hypothetical protein